MLELCPTGSPYTGHPVSFLGFFPSFLAVLGVFFFFFKILFIYFCLSGSSLLCSGFSLVARSRGYSSLAVRRLLIAVASLVAKHGL